MASTAKDKLSKIAREMKAELDSGTTPSGGRVTVREFLGWFGYLRRGTQIVTLIRATLAELDLRTVPDFEREYTDVSILIELDKDAAGMKREP